MESMHTARKKKHSSKLNCNTFSVDLKFLPGLFISLRFSGNPQNLLEAHWGSLDPSLNPCNAKINLKINKCYRNIVHC